MCSSKLKFYYILRVLLSAAALAGIGGLMLLADAYASEVFDVLLIAMGIFGVIGNLPTLLLSLQAVTGRTLWKWISLSLSLVGMLLGVALILLQRDSAVMPVLLVLYSVVLPICKIVLVEKKRKQFSLELPKIFFGLLVLIVTLTRSEDRVFYLMGVACIGIAVLYLLWRLITMRSYLSACWGRDMTTFEQSKL